ncbi:hypothetical protein AU381_25985 [Sinorhizobium glycinis]|uniref:Uncharacterized protein n=1 Tax=Sinorhizobium glycinis TaxID=1472378 RepID=A0A178XIZ1_9HYPH|nr:hypothetical protein [Sinorhizobium glycinis]OAP35197.1 hypothetical protein AU381_25985 [Sinorhizobium glycinis]
MNIPNSAKAHPRAPPQPLADKLPSWLRRRRGLVVLGILVLGLGAAFNWSWLVAVGVAPLLLSLLPCVAMCALGLCMKHMAVSHGKASTTVSSETDAVPAPLEAPRSCCASRSSDITAVER